MKKLLLLLLFAIPVFAQVQPMPWEKAQFLDNNGHPAAGGCLFTYISGTTTPLATYTDYTGNFLNSNPVILDSAGRADIWLLAQAYSFRLKTHGGTACASGTQLWTEDGINPSANSILAFNNVWTGLNTFNAAVTFNSTASFTTGLTASGPVNMNAGGAMSGTFTGSPIFSGTPNFSGGMQATTGLFTDKITSTVATGTAPLVIASTTQVGNLNVSQLEGFTWESPSILGGTVPNVVNASALTATSVTDTALTSGQCVRAGTGGLLNGYTCPQPAVVSRVRKTLSGTVQVPQNVLTTIDSQAMTMPATGCPCRVLINVSYFNQAVGGTAPYSTTLYVDDGTTKYAGSNSGSSNSVVQSGNSASDVTAPYANNAVVTFTVKAFSDKDTEMLASSLQVSAVSSYMTLTVMPSN